MAPVATPNQGFLKAKAMFHAPSRRDVRRVGYSVSLLSS